VGGVVRVALGFDSGRGLMNKTTRLQHIQSLVKDMVLLKARLSPLHQYGIIILATHCKWVCGTIDRY
jgi:hypothetical protein